MQFMDRNVTALVRIFARRLRGRGAGTSVGSSRRRKRFEARSSEILEQRICLFANDWSGEPIHEQITQDGLSFLNESVLTQIKGSNIWVDVNLLDDHFDGEKHFVGCLFREGAANINTLYQEALEYANPANFQSENLADTFGQILHPAQDFYAHSNWVELGLSKLIEGGTGLWDALHPFSLHAGAMLIQGEQNAIPPDYTLSLDDEFRVTVTTPTGTFPGVISATYGITDDCPDNVAVSHSSLNKDDDTRQHFAQARALAVAQTRQEFIRLVSLIENKYGTAAPVLATWVKRDDASRALLQQFFAGHTSSPQIPGELAVDFDRHNSRLAVSWNRAVDPDSVDSRITYQITYSSSPGFEDATWHDVSVGGTRRQVALDDEFWIGVRATDEYGNESTIKSFHFSYPVVDFVVTQTLRQPV